MERDNGGATVEPMTFDAGTHIQEAARLLVAEAHRRGRRATGIFNDVTLAAEPTTAASDVVAAFRRDMQAAHDAYKASPAGVEAARRDAAELASAQDVADQLVARLPSLDFTDASAVIDWITAMQEPSDRKGIVIPKNEIIAAFAAHGWKPGMNCGDEYRDDDLDNRAHWIVGQALETLSAVAIHPMVNLFADQWRAAASLSTLTPEHKP